jgi:hypothetical protein
MSMASDAQQENPKSIDVDLQGSTMEADVSRVQVDKLLHMPCKQSLHLRNGTIELGLKFAHIMNVGQLSTIRLTDMRLVVVLEYEAELAAMEDNRIAPVVIASHPGTSLILENCSFEVSFDSPVLDRLVGCMVEEGAHVGLDCPVWCCVCNSSSSQLLPASEGKSSPLHLGAQLPSNWLGYSLQCLIFDTNACAAGDNDQLQVYRVQACRAYP